ncbi:hypothetical protein [Halopenitus persicus]|uniref:hypothetical protein n=1 Tax=Halopenitus persicus TaxID=1048396 RepID=UPI0012FD0EEA|nr:hypothetical protein [Halopenitus persicus]
MATDPSFRLKLNTATALRDWLLDMSQCEPTERAVAESLAELAAGIDGQLHGQSEYLEIAVTPTNFPPTNSSASPNAQSDVGEGDDLASQDTDAGVGPVERDPVDDGHRGPSQVYDALPNDAWHPPTGGDRTRSEGSSTSMTDYQQTPTAASSRNRSDHDEDSAAFQFVTSYECSVCGAIQEMETSLQVCAFVDDCASCGTVDVRFTAVGIPEPIHDST